MSRRFNFAALAVLLFVITPQVTSAATLSQSGAPNPLANTNMLWAAIAGGILVTVVVLGAVISLVAAFITRFFAKNVPPADKLAALNALPDSAGIAPRKPAEISPTLEPFVISVVAFVVVFILASLLVTPPAQKSAASGAETTPAPSNALTVTNDAAGAAKVLATLPKGNADAGAKLYTSAGCIGCHSLVKDKVVVGPSWYGLWGRAATRKPGYTADQYIYESIVNPNTFIIQGFQPNIMPPTFAKQLSPQDMANLLAYIQRDMNQK